MKLPQGKYQIEVSYVPVKALVIAKIVAIIGWLIITFKTILELGKKSNGLV